MSHPPAVRTAPPVAAERRLRTGTLADAILTIPVEDVETRVRATLAKAVTACPDLPPATARGVWSGARSSTTRSRQAQARGPAIPGSGCASSGSDT